MPIIKIEDYSYPLESDKIAKYPLEEREASKILIFEENIISESKFSNLAHLLPSNSLLLFNKTRVIPARLLFQKITGAVIEIFCLEPDSPLEYNLNFAAIGSCSWEVVIGNVKRWKEGQICAINGGVAELIEIDLRATLISKSTEKQIVEFSWKGDITFGEILEKFGKIPIPPYLNRESQPIDYERYQTVYATIKGSVAAPTAGLHFTPRIMNELTESGIKYRELVLHVGAGTFLPVKVDNVYDHKMHSELFSLSIELLNDIKDHLIDSKPIVAVGTTSVRTLESAYWMGVKVMRGLAPTDIEQWEPYENDSKIKAIDAFTALINWMELNRLDSIDRRTHILIIPGYTFRVVDILITNFHQPKSTLLLLIAAFIGESWRDVYNYALDNNFRFLSYGDSSLLVRAKD